MSKFGRTVSEPSSYHTKITEWPEGERPREKLANHGSARLSDAELLAIVLRTGAGKITAVDLAKKLLIEFESLERLATCSAEELQSLHGMGPAKAAAILAAFELGRRSASLNRSRRFQVRSPEDVVNRFQPLMRDLKQEKFNVLLLDSANNLLREVEITSGILNSSLVHPREVFADAIYVGHPGRQNTS